MDRGYPVSPDELIVKDDNSGTLYRIPFEVGDQAEVSFGDPVAVVVTYSDVAAGGRIYANRSASEVEGDESERMANTNVATDEPDEVEATIEATAAVGAGAALAALLEELNAGDQVSELADAAGISESTVRQILRGDINAPPLRRLEGMASVLNVSVKRLVDAATEDGGNYDTDEEASAATTAASAGVVTLDAGAMASLQADAKLGREAREQQLSDRRTGIINAAVTDGKIPPARREHWVALWQADPEGTEQTIGQLAAGVVPVSELGTSTDASGGTGETAGQTAYPSEWFPEVANRRAEVAE